MLHLLYGILLIHINGFLRYKPVDIQLVAFILVIIFLFLLRSITFADQSYAYTLIKISSPIVCAYEVCQKGLARPHSNKEYEKR